MRARGELFSDKPQGWSFRHFHSPHISHAPAVSALNKHHSDHAIKPFFLPYYL